MRRRHAVFPLLILLAAAWGEYKNDPALFSLPRPFGEKYIASVISAQTGGQTHLSSSHLNAAISTFLAVEPESGRCYAPGAKFPAVETITYAGHGEVGRVRTEAEIWVEGIGFGTPGHTSTIGQEFTECNPKYWADCGGCRDCTCAGNCTIRMPPGPGRYRLVQVTELRSEVVKAEVLREVTISESCHDDTEVELIPPKEYDQWLPQAGEDESTLGDSIDVQIVAHKKGDPNAGPPKKVKKYTIELEDTSREKGVDLNWPPKDKAKDDFDMKIDKDNPWISVTDGDNAQKAETKQEGLTQFMVTVNSYDWGGYTKLQVTAELEDGSSVVGHVQGNSGEETLTLPKDDNNNHIADFWEKHYLGGASGANADDDLVPIGDGHQGDGLSLYEEYRGFHVNGQHISTNPILKDLFIFDPDGLGLGLFAASGITTHLVKKNEFADEGGATNPHVINPNRGFGTLGAQHLLVLKNENMPGLYGLADGTGPGPPKTTHTVKIDKARCLSTSPGELQCTIAHELAHACNVWHHGDIDYEIGRWSELQADGTWGVWLHYTNGDNRGVAAQRGQESGVEECIMRYDGNNLYETAAGPILWQKPDGSLQRGAEYPPMEPAGTIFCDKVEGTGVNAPGLPGGPKAGNAFEGRGKCRKQFCVDDSKPCTAAK